MKTFQENRDYMLSQRRNFIITAIDAYKNGEVAQEQAVISIENVIEETADAIIKKVKSDMQANQEKIENLDNFEIG
jgi:F420-dependent methylenetetrahydromethanopterin dehydrogenase